MLNAREREAPREIQHQFSAEKPGVARPLPAMHGRSPSDRHRPMYTTAVLVTTATPAWSPTQSLSTWD
jgi:hypothetical protein